MGSVIPHQSNAVNIPHQTNAGLNIKLGRMRNFRISTFAKIYSFKCHRWRYLVDNWFWFGFLRRNYEEVRCTGSWTVADIWFFQPDSIWSHRALCVERYNSNLSLYCKPDSATVASFLYKLCSYSHYICRRFPAVHCSKMYIIDTKIHFR